MDIVFVGGFFPEHLTDAILKKSKNQVQISADIFQWAFINGLERNLGKSLKLITAPYIGWYPKYYTELIVRTSHFLRNDGSTRCVMVGFCNLPLLKNIFKYWNLRNHLEQLISGKEHTIIIVYSLDAAYLRAAIRMKMHNPRIRVCVIIPDLLEFPGDASFLYKWYIKYCEKPLFYKLLSKIDGFVVLTDKMIDFLKVNHKPWVRIEGLYDVRENISAKQPNANSGKKIILYTGVLDYKFGIKELMDAFQLIASKDYQLWICGGGMGADFVKQRALSDERIRYFGIVSKQRAREMQREATLLINPRNSIGDYNKYSFPSKTMEYLASGTPTLMYKLDGIPDEYYNYCYTIMGDGVEGLSSSMYETCQLDTKSLDLKGSIARDFILNNKNADVQTKKIVALLNGLLNC